MLMRQFESLGNAVASAWGCKNHDSAAFPQIAAEALQRAHLSENVSGDQIIKWVATAPWLPQQENLALGFGEPPITVFWHPMFYIEVLYWTVGSPNVHQHAFSGAFTVLEGSSIQSRYQFQPDRRVNAHMLLGSLDVRDVKLLRKGDIEPIYSGTELIHATFHLDMPSITIVVRTYTDIESHPQYSYYRPCLAINEFHEDSLAVRRIQTLVFLEQVKSDRFDEIAELLIRNSDLYVGYRILRHLRFSAAAAKIFDHLIVVAREKHGPVVESLKAVLDELDREAVIRSRRALVTSPDLRFYLALLMNVSSRSAILSLVQQYFPGADPKQVVAQWAYEMSGRDLSGIEFNDLNRKLFRHLIDGVSVSDVIARLEEQYAAEEIHEHRARLIERCTKIRNSTIFKPLLQQAA